MLCRFMRCGLFTFVGLIWAATASAQIATGSPVADAVQRRDRTGLGALLQQRADVNAAQADGATALHWAALHDDVETVDLLVRAGAKVNAVNEYGVTPLSLAALNGSDAVIARLLDGGADPNQALPTGESPLMTAARTGRLDPVTRLLASGAAVNARESVKGQTALMWAISERHDEVAVHLVKHGADVSAASISGFTPLMFAVREGDMEITKLLVEAGADVNAAASDGVSVLLVATVRNQPVIAEYLLDNGADPNADKAGYTPLIWAAGKWEGEMTHDYPHAEGEWGSLIGVTGRKAELLKALLAHGANPNARIARKPPRFGVNLFNMIRVEGATAFWVAALSGDAETMRLLAAHGADPLAASKEMVTPLMVAAGTGRAAGDSLITEAESLAAVKAALALGNDVNAAATNGETALHATAYYGLDLVAEYLVQQGADVNARNKKGETPRKIAEGTVVNAMFQSHKSTADVLRRLGGIVD